MSVGASLEVTVRTSLVALGTALLLSACSSHGPTSSAIPGAVAPLSSAEAINGPPPGQALVTANFGGGFPGKGVIRTYNRAANGNVYPAWWITGNNTLLSEPFATATDPAGNLWVDQGGYGGFPSILEFAASARRNTQPIFSLGRQLCKVGYNSSSGAGIAFDPSGYLYFLNYAQGDGHKNCIQVFPPGSKVATREIDDPGLINPASIVYRAGMVYVADASSNAIDGYPATASGTVSPTFQLKGPQTQLNGPVSIGFDKDGALYVLQIVDPIEIYDNPVSGDMAPTRSFVPKAINSNPTVYAMVIGPVTMWLVDAQDANTWQIQRYRDIATSGSNPLSTIVGPHTLITGGTGGLSLR